MTEMRTSGFYLRCFRCIVFGSLSGVLTSYAGSELELRITAYGTLVSEQLVTAADLDFGRPVAIESLAFFNANGDLQPFYFVADPGSNQSGRLYWMWDQFPPFQGIHYTLRMSPGESDSTSSGCPDLAVAVAGQSLLVPNYTFAEISADDPVGWRLTGGATIHTADAFRGLNSILLIGRMDADGKSQTSGMQSSEIQLKPETEYRLRVRMKVTEQRETGARHQGIMAQIGYFRDGGARISRSFHFFPRANTASDEYLGQWVALDVNTISPAEFDYASVTVSTMGGFDGKCLIDYVILEEFSESHPLRIEVSRLRGIK